MYVQLIIHAYVHTLDTFLLYYSKIKIKVLCKVHETFLTMSSIRQDLYSTMISRRIVLIHDRQQCNSVVVEVRLWNSSLLYQNNFHSISS